MLHRSPFLTGSVINYHSVSQMNPPLRNLRDLVAVCDHDQRRQVLIGNASENLQHFLRISMVEVPGRFIGQKQFWSMHKSARDSRALHLAPAELMHKMMLSFLHAHKTKHLPGTGHGLAEFDPLKLQWHADVFQHLESRKEAAKLEHNPHVAP